MKKSYTLNEFYRSAQRLIEKHNAKLEGHVLSASFEIEDRKGSPELCCVIRYHSDHEYRFFANASAPEPALMKFEADILKVTGNSEIDKVCVETPGEATCNLIP